MSNIQWFPGHMAKTGRELAESVKLADLVIEVIDARVPGSSLNPDFNKIFAGRRRLVALNKADLADPSRTGDWINHFRNGGYEAVSTNSNKSEGISRIRRILQDAAAEKTNKLADRGVINRPLRAIVAGIPNSGKSSLINRLAEKSTAKTGDKPGITKSRQWIAIGNGIVLLDTPGVLWPRFENSDVALHLAFTGAIRDEVYDTVDAAEKLLEFLCINYSQLVKDRYGDISVGESPSGKNGDNGRIINGVDSVDGNDASYTLLEKTGKKRGFLLRGGLIDYNRTAAIVLDEFRAAKIGRITLESPTP